MTLNVTNLIGFATGNNNFPRIKQVSQFRKATISPASNITMPSNVVSGDLLVVILSAASDTQQNITTIPSGWTRATPKGTAGYLRVFDIFYKFANGTEGSTTLNFGAGVNNTSCAYAICIENASAIEAATMANGTSGAPNSPSISPSWGPANTLFIAACGQVSGLAVQSEPTGYKDMTQTNSGFGSGDRPRVAFCIKNGAFITSENPDAFGTSISTLAGAVIGWSATTIAIKPKS